MALAHRLDPELAHQIAINGLSLASHFPSLLGLLPAFQLDTTDKPLLRQLLWGYEFSHPLGLAAGFDKDARAVPALWQLGFSFVEVGSLTPQPQKGNAKPRLFRLANDEAILNRMGFNSQGLTVATARLVSLRKAHSRDNQNSLRLGVNLGKNKSSEALDDFPLGAKTIGGLADYIVINLSSPNTPGLRNLQEPEAIKALIEATRQSLLAINCPHVPLLVKLAPDFSIGAIQELAALLINLVDGVILTNTTIARPPSLQSRLPADSAGGLSGKPLAKLARLQLLAFNEINQGRIPIIACGGISDSRDAYARLLMGASLLQIYSAMIYKGPYLIADLVKAIARHLRDDGFQNISEAIGADPKRGKMLAEIEA